jgi:hypothetical protein
MVTRRVSEEAAEQWLITSAAAAQVYRFIQRWGLRRARVWAMNRVLQFLPDGLVDLINFLSRMASFPPDPRAAEDTEILSRRFGFGGTVDGEELRC